MLSTKFDFILLSSLEDETCRQTDEQALHTLKFCSWIMVLVTVANLSE
jgi:hypothetical protein